MSNQNPTNATENPFTSTFNWWRTEYERMSNETMKAFDRSYSEMDKAMGETSRLVQAQLNASREVGKVMNDAVLRLMNVSGKGH